MESIDFGVLLAGATRYTEGINPTWKGVVQTHTEDKMAFVKQVDTPYELYVECACAIVGRVLGLPIPKPIIVQIPSAYTATSINVLGYGSEDAGYPSFRRFVQDQNVVQKLFEFEKTLDAAIFDELIGNWDRNVGNMLYDGGKEFVFIDHGKSIEKTLPVDSPAARNQLIDVLYSQRSELDKYRYMRIAQQGLLSQYGMLPFAIIPAKTYASVYVGDDDTIHVVEFLKSRLNYIENLLRQRLGIPPLAQREVLL